MFLVGNQQHALDDKNRIRLPAKFREQLGSSYILMPGTNG
ncbi:MAG: cell division/cell wall cluster transcriptional repressor MraZ, partial [Clostridia bacterium]|nr:cell division/cell wall cluster transcriptional repressor MraZ [Clostridia bacterium]